MCSEGFSITWSDHARNVVGVLGRYLDEGTLIDCTIVAEGEYLKAHRLVLSACSTYFELLFGQEMKEKVVLEDIKFKDLKSLIAFMYEGQITIPKDRLRDFVRAAEFLQIRGLPNKLVENSLTEATEMPVGCAKEGLALQSSHEDLGCPASSGQSSHLQWIASICKNESGGERHSTYVQTDLLKENVFLQPQSILNSDSNRETTVFPPEKVPSVEPKEEVDVEDTPIWEGEDENTSAETDFSSATAGESVANERTPVPGTICSSSSFDCSPQVLEESVTSIATLSSVTTTIPSSTNTASSPLVPNVPIEQSGGAMEDCSLSVHSELAEQSIRFKTEPVLKTEVIPAVVSLHRESVVEPMHEVWVEELRFWDSEEVIAETDAIDRQETRLQDVDAAGSCENNQSAMRTNDIFKDFSFSHVVARIEKKHVNAQEVKEETEVAERCTGQECESIDVIESTGDRVVESGRRSTVQVHNDNLLNGEHEMKGQEIIVNTLERTSEADVAVEQSDAEEESAPLLERVSKMLGKKLHRCRRCPGVFCTVSELRFHVKNVHDKKSSKRCEVCLATFAWKSHLLRHMTRHTGERPFKCELGENSFNRSSELTKHKRINTGERSFHCDVCERSFGVKKTLIAHMRTHTGERPFHCHVCERAYIHKRNLTTHMRTHTVERPFHCGVCKRAFNHKCALTVHMRTHTGVCPFQCNVCARSFIDRGNLGRHMRTHTGERSFHCDVCERAYIHKRDLITHMRTHTGERPFQCDVCKKTFVLKGTLTIHMRTHTTVRPFQCNVCRRSFTDSNNLTTHMRRHTDKRSLHCDVCKRSFTDKGRLQTHIRTHTGERPFQCNVCKRSFSDKGNLQRHIRTHTGERPFQCNVCKRFFSVKSNLGIHMRTHTG